MKKRALAALVTVSLVASVFVGCGGKKVDCELCGETKTGKTYEIMGEEGDICNDCYKDNKEALDILTSLKDEEDAEDLSMEDALIILSFASKYADLGL